jgi:hypothetical protein
MHPVSEILYSVWKIKRWTKLRHSGILCAYTTENIIRNNSNYAPHGGSRYR